LQLKLPGLTGELGVEGSDIGAVGIALCTRRIELLTGVGRFFLQRDERAAVDPGVADLRQSVSVADVATGKRRQRVDFAADRRGQ